jgi:hypothetical protein
MGEEPWFAPADCSVVVCGNYLKEAEPMKPTLRRGNEMATLRSRRIDLTSEYGYSDATAASEPPSGAEIRSAFPARFDASFLRRDRQYGRLWAES